MYKLLPLLFMFLLMFGCTQAPLQQAPRQLFTTVVPISNFHQIAGTWGGLVSSRRRPDVRNPVQVVIDRFGHYEFTVTRPNDLFSGTGNFTIRNGRAVTRAIDGYATFTLFEEGDKRMLTVLARMVKPTVDRYNANLFPVK